MKYILFLLAAIFSADRGASVGAEVMGVTNIDVEPCSKEDQDFFYQKCVLEVAVAEGVVLSRRLEVRGERGLQAGGTCSGCGTCPECYLVPVPVVGETFWSTRATLRDGHGIRTLTHRTYSSTVLRS